MFEDLFRTLSLAQMRRAQAAQPTSSPKVQAALDALARPAGGPLPAPAPVARITLPTRPLCGPDALRYRSAVATDVRATHRRARKAQAGAVPAAQSGRMSVDDLVGLACIVILAVLLSLLWADPVGDGSMVSAALGIAWIRKAQPDAAQPCSRYCTQGLSACQSPQACGLPLHDDAEDQLELLGGPVETGLIALALMLLGHLIGLLIPRLA